MPNLSLAEGRERLLDVCIKLGSARRDLAMLQHWLGFGYGRRTLECIMTSRSILTRRERQKNEELVS